MTQKKSDIREKLISVIVPFLNEEANLKILYKRLIKTLSGFGYEIIFINDGSSDSSQDIVEDIIKKDSQVKLINFSKNFGHQVAVSCGLDFASGDAVVIIDADLQDPPELIPEMIKKWQEGFDVVYAKRKYRDGETIFKKLSAKIFYRLLNMLSGTKIPVDTGDFRLISKRVVLNLRRTKEYRRFLRGIVSWIGFPQTGVEFVREKRHGGKSHYTPIAMIKLAIDATLSFSIVPLRLASFMGVFTVIFAVSFAAFAFYRNTIGETVRGWSSTVFIILFLGSIQLIAIGIIGEYLGRIYEEVKKRPLYIIDSVSGFDDADEVIQGKVKV